MKSVLADADKREPVEENGKSLLDNLKVVYDIKDVLEPWRRYSQIKVNPNKSYKMMIKVKQDQLENKPTQGTDGGSKIQVTSLVVMGGIGQTTIVGIVHNDAERQTISTESEDVHRKVSRVQRPARKATSASKIHPQPRKVVDTGPNTNGSHGERNNAERDGQKNQQDLHGHRKDDRCQEFSEILSLKILSSFGASNPAVSRSMLLAATSDHLAGEALASTLAAEKLKEEVTFLVGVRKEGEKLQKNLIKMKSVLADADKREPVEENGKSLLDNLKVVYDIKDVLEPWRWYSQIKVNPNKMMIKMKQLVLFSWRTRYAFLHVYIPTPCSRFKPIKKVKVGMIFVGF
ncbi:hypothetical protein Dimus_023846 [Dionaea muscipula]